MPIAAMFLVAGSLCVAALSQDSAAVFSSYHAEKRYDFRVSRDEIARAPKWTDDQPNPPLPARRADAIATDYMRELFPDDVDQWRRGKIVLVPVAGNWVYVVEFHY